MTPAVPELPERSDPPLIAGEREMLETWLDFHRATLLMKCVGLTDEQLKQRSVPPSGLSLLGLVRHMAEVEQLWFRRVVGGEEITPRFWTDDDPDGDFDSVDDAAVAEDLAFFRAECDHSREVLAGYESLELEAPGRTPSRGLFNVRWVMVHMIEEYARHNGHADLLRECIDGAVGD